MPSDSELRDRFREGTQPRGEIDVDAVLRRVRARRRPRLALAGAASVLAIAGIAVPAVLTSSSPGAEDTALVAGDAYAPESAAGGAADAQAAPPSADRLNLCMAPLTEVAPSAEGLVMSVAQVVADAGLDSIPVTVTLTNTGDSSIFGTTTGRPSLTLSRDGITLWHTNGPQDMSARIVDLGPGESMTYQTSFEPRVCAAEDDAAEAFRDDLPPAGPGRYRLSAAIDVSHDDDGSVDLVTGPQAEVTLR